MKLRHKDRLGLPEGDVPPEIVRLLPLDKAHDQLQPNKNATPVQGAVDYDEIKKRWLALE